MKDPRTLDKASKKRRYSQGGDPRTFEVQAMSGAGSAGSGLVRYEAAEKTGTKRGCSCEGAARGDAGTRGKRLTSRVACRSSASALVGSTALASLCHEVGT